MSKGQLILPCQTPIPRDTTALYGWLCQNSPDWDLCYDVLSQPEVHNPIFSRKSAKLTAKLYQDYQAVLKLNLKSLFERMFEIPGWETSWDTNHKWAAGIELSASRLKPIPIENGVTAWVAKNFRLYEPQTVTDDTKWDIITTHFIAQYLGLMDLRSIASPEEPIGPYWGINPMRLGLPSRHIHQYKASRRPPVSPSLQFEFLPVNDHDVLSQISGSTAPCPYPFLERQDLYVILEDIGKESENVGLLSWLEANWEGFSNKYYPQT